MLASRRKVAFGWFGRVHRGFPKIPRIIIATHSFGRKLYVCQWMVLSLLLSYLIESTWASQSICLGILKYIGCSLSRSRDCPNCFYFDNQ